MESNKLRFEIEGDEKAVKELLGYIGASISLHTRDQAYRETENKARLSSGGFSTMGEIRSMAPQQQEEKPKAKRRTRAQIEADKLAEEAAKTPTEVVDTEDLGSVFPTEDENPELPTEVQAEPVDAPVVEPEQVEEQIAPVVDLEPAKDLEPMPAEEGVSEISLDAVRSEIIMYRKRIAPKVPGNDLEEKKAATKPIAVALIHRFGQAEKLAEVEPQFRQAIIDACQADWMPEQELTDDFDV